MKRINERGCVTPERGRGKRTNTKARLRAGEMREQ